MATTVRKGYYLTACEGYFDLLARKFQRAEVEAGRPMSFFEAYDLVMKRPTVREVYAVYSKLMVAQTDDLQELRKRLTPAELVKVTNLLGV